MSSTATPRRGPWSPSEDERLLALINDHGPSNWVRISQLLATRTPKQCRERYHQNLKPSLNHSPISDEEGMLIEHLVAQYGKRWAEIARHLNGRSDNAVKNWWNGGANRRRRASLQVDGLGSQQAQQPHHHQQQHQVPPPSVVHSQVHSGPSQAMQPSQSIHAAQGHGTHPHAQLQAQLQQQQPPHPGAAVQYQSPSASASNTPAMQTSPGGMHGFAGSAAYSAAQAPQHHGTAGPPVQAQLLSPHTPSMAQFNRYPPIGHRVSLPNISTNPFVHSQGPNPPPALQVPTPTSSSGSSTGSSQGQVLGGQHQPVVFNAAYMGDSPGFGNKNSSPDLRNSLNGSSSSHKRGASLHGFSPYSRPKEHSISVPQYQGQQSQSRRVSTSSVFSRRSRANSLGSSNSDSEEPLGGSYSLSRYSLSGSVTNSRRNSQVMQPLLPPLALENRPSDTSKCQPRAGAADEVGEKLKISNLLS